MAPQNTIHPIPIAAEFEEKDGEKTQAVLFTKNRKIKEPVFCYMLSSYNKAKSIYIASHSSVMRTHSIG